MQARTRSTITTTLRRALVACLALALTLVGVAMPRASADEDTDEPTHVWLSGSGKGNSKRFRLDPGLYTVELDYQYGTSGISVALSDDNGPYELLDYNDERPGGTIRILWIGGNEGDLRISVNTGDLQRSWEVLITDLTSYPTKSVRSFTARGRGLNTSDLYLLEPGTYSFTTSYTGSEFWDTGHVFEVDLRAIHHRAGKAVSLVTTTEKTASVSGSRTSTVKVSKPSLFWIDPWFAWTQVAWKVAVGPKLTSTPKPKITGSLAVGKTLTAEPGTWKPAPVKVKYQWHRGKSKISGATAQTYKLTAADLGTTITVTVKGPAYEPTVKTSAATAKITAGTLTKATPTISGTPKVGKKLTAKPLTWGPGTVSKKHQWYRGSTKIAGATKSTYMLTRYDKGKTIKVKVTGSKSGYITASKTSKPTAKVA